MEEYAIFVDFVDKKALACRRHGAWCHAERCV